MRRPVPTLPTSDLGGLLSLPTSEGAMLLASVGWSLSCWRNARELKLTPAELEPPTTPLGADLDDRTLFGGGDMLGELSAAADACLRSRREPATLRELPSCCMRPARLPETMLLSRDFTVFDVDECPVTLRNRVASMTFTAGFPCSSS